MMRTKSNLARGIFPQLRIALLHGLTWKLFSLYYEIEAIRSKLEVRYVIIITLPAYHVMMTSRQLRVDAKKLHRVNNTGNVARTLALSPAGGKQS